MKATIGAKNTTRRELLIFLLPPMTSWHTSGFALWLKLLKNDKFSWPKKLSPDGAERASCDHSLVRHGIVAEWRKCMDTFFTCGH